MAINYELERTRLQIARLELNRLRLDLHKMELQMMADLQVQQAKNEAALQPLREHQALDMKWSFKEGKNNPMVQSVRQQYNRWREERGYPTI
jgi:uncharacterized protein involved in exopolysaccharide biosynthesis